MDFENNHFARCLTTPLTKTSGGNWLCSGSGFDGSDSHGYYPYGGYDSSYGGSDSSYGGYYGYGVFDANAPYLSGLSPFWGVPSAVPSMNYNFINSIGLYP